MTSKQLPRYGFEAHADAVYAWAYRVLGRHHDALDVAQDVFLRWNRQCESAPPAEPQGWLRRVTLNRAVDLIRQSHRESPPRSLISREPSASANGLEQSDQDILRRDIAAAMENLSDAQRSVLVAKVYDGLTFAGIARELDVAVSTVKTHYVRAVSAVRDQLGKRWSET
jgi:RNA polymerase sigma-70 factor, ECF subfamily